MAGSEKREERERARARSCTCVATPYRHPCGFFYYTGGIPGRAVGKIDHAIAGPLAQAPLENSTKLKSSGRRTGGFPSDRASTSQPTLARCISTRESNRTYTLASISLKNLEGASETSQHHSMGFSECSASHDSISRGYFIFLFLIRRGYLPSAAPRRAGRSNPVSRGPARPCCR